MFSIEQISNAHSKVKSGADFPRYIQDLKELGVTGFETRVMDSQTIYHGRGEFQISSDSKYAALEIAEKSNRELFLNLLKAHQKGETDYMQFCIDCAKTGIKKWVVSLDRMTCIYYDQAGEEILVEEIPSLK